MHYRTCIFILHYFEWYLQIHKSIKMHMTMVTWAFQCFSCVCVNMCIWRISLGGILGKCGKWNMNSKVQQYYNKMFASKQKDHCIKSLTSHLKQRVLHASTENGFIQMKTWCVFGDNKKKSNKRMKTWHSHKFTCGFDVIRDLTASLTFFTKK